MPGHTVHFCQAKRSWEAAAETPRPRGEILSLDGEVIVVASREGSTNYRNHEVGRLRLIVEQFGPGVEIDNRFGILVVNSFYVCVQVDTGELLEPCVDPRDLPKVDSAEGFALRILTLGGGYVDLSRCPRRETRS